MARMQMDWNKFFINISHSIYTYIIKWNTKAKERNVQRDNSIKLFDCLMAIVIKLKPWELSECFAAPQMFLVEGKKWIREVIS